MDKRLRGVGGKHSRYFGRVFQKYAAPLRDDFRAQLGDDSEAEECMWEALENFFIYMDDRCWDPDEELMDFRVKMIAGGVCTKRLVRKMAPRAGVAARREEGFALDKMSHEVMWLVHVRTGFRQLFHRVLGGFRQPRLKPLTAAFR